MPSEYVSIKLSRDNHGDSWGFTIAGGKDVGEPLAVQYVSSKNEREGILSYVYLQQNRLNCNLGCR